MTSDGFIVYGLLSAEGFGFVSQTTSYPPVDVPGVIASGQGSLFIFLTQMF